MVLRIPNLYKQSSKATRKSALTARTSASRASKTTSYRARQASARSYIRNQETKYFDTAQSIIVADGADWTGTEVTNDVYIQGDGTTVGAYTDCALIPSAVGTGYGQIQGNRYKLKKLRVRGIVRGLVKADQADMSNAQTIRVVLVMDTRPDGAQAQGENIFTDLGDNLNCQFSFLEMGQSQAGKFKILADETFVLNNIVAGTDGASTNSLGYETKQFSFTYAPKEPIDVRIKSSGTTPATSQLANCNIFLLAHAGSSANGAELYSASRAYFCE